MEHKLTKLRIYGMALDLTVDVYRFTKKFPKEEKYELIKQIRRAASSVGANIAEGYSRRTPKDQNHFFYNSKGSIWELIFFFELSTKLKYGEAKFVQQLKEKYLDLDIRIYNYMQHVAKRDK